jgi:hypothetical protein
MQKIKTLNKSLLSSKTTNKKLFLIITFALLSLTRIFRMFRLRVFYNFITYIICTLIVGIFFIKNRIKYLSVKIKCFNSFFKINLKLIFIYLYKHLNAIFFLFFYTI